MDKLQYENQYPSKSDSLYISYIKYELYIRYTPFHYPFLKGDSSFFNIDTLSTNNLAIRKVFTLSKGDCVHNLRMNLFSQKLIQPSKV